MPVASAANGARRVPRHAAKLPPRERDPARTAWRRAGCGGRLRRRRRGALRRPGDRSGAGEPPPEAAGRPSGLGMLFSSDRRARLAPAFVENLSRIHHFAEDLGAASLVSFERPQAKTKEAADGVIAWWRRVWDDDAIDDHPMVEVAFDWLEENSPPTDTISLVHGDYRSGNFLFDHETNVVTAILEWELVCYGYRHEDVG